MPLIAAKLAHGICEQFQISSSAEWHAQSPIGWWPEVQVELELDRVVATASGAQLNLPLLKSNHNQRFELREPAAEHFGDGLRRLERPSAENPLPFSSEFLGKSPGGQTLAAWFGTLGRLNQSAAGSSTFYQEAARAIIEPGGLDVGHVLLDDRGRWRSAACSLRDEELGFAFEPIVMSRMTSENIALFHPSAESSIADQAESVVCAPVFGVNGQIVAAVYGARSHAGKNQRRGIRPLEALWVQLVAESLTSAHARFAREAEAARTQVLLEQAFPREVADELLRDATALKGQHRKVTALFADLRQSSMISEALPPTALCDLLSEVLTEITEAAMIRGGVVVDYHGDGMAAMWNAPQDQPDHADLAVHAAINMVHRISQLNERWKEQLPVDLKLVVGIHTGDAIVGNTGTKHRIKYGPRGAAINTASRLESAAKVLDISILTSSETMDAVSDDQLVARRAAIVSLRGIPEHVRLYEIVPISKQDALLDRISAFEEVLNLLETGQIKAADSLLQGVIAGDATIEVPKDIDLLCAQLEQPTRDPAERALDLASY